MPQPALLSAPPSASLLFPPPNPKPQSFSFLPLPTLPASSLAARPAARSLIRVRAVAAIEKETPENERPDTFLQDDQDAQDSVCAAIEAVDGGKFKEDVWSRPGGGGGISRVLQDGDVWEKAGVNVSVVYGVMPPEAYRAAKGDGSASNNDAKAGPVPFFAAGISSVLHPQNPFAPTLHFNYRYFETDAPKDTPGAPRQWWFGGGTDLTPAYIVEEDVRHFHTVQKQACDKFDPSFYPRFKKWCDDYFFIKTKWVYQVHKTLADVGYGEGKFHFREAVSGRAVAKHRGERRGLGGIFFDDLNDYDQEMLLAFSTECTKSVIPAYIPLIERRKDTPFTEQHKAWQQLRRGRYVEFNLVYDRGTTFGLKTGGRIESILVSLPLTARWEYNHLENVLLEKLKLVFMLQQPEEGSEEWKLLDACINPKEWI
ncbi:Chloroperoxidase 1 [Asimina triloba]